MDAYAVSTYPRLYDSLFNVISSIKEGDLDLDSLNLYDSNTFGSYVSCGVTVLSGLIYNTPANIVHKILVERQPQDYKAIKEAFVIFSDVDYQGHNCGNALYRYIRDNPQFGEVAEFGPRMNPNSGNMIKLWVWLPAHASLEQKDKHMPVKGKVITRNARGYSNGWADAPVPDARFEDKRQQGNEA